MQRRNCRARSRKSRCNTTPLLPRHHFSRFIEVFDNSLDVGSTVLYFNIETACQVIPFESWRFPRRSVTREHLGIQFVIYNFLNRRPIKLRVLAARLSERIRALVGRIYDRLFWCLAFPSRGKHRRAPAIVRQSPIYGCAYRTENAVSDTAFLLCTGNNLLCYAMKLFTHRLPHRHRLYIAPGDDIVR